ncbi:hypothetical protein NDU88_004602 [Pleurodeles waltl]|uniref:Uncharacterized protein n=1 Tax=Pleurodeles waltl TaxID=8319 RepID=A0AAV7L973_PLEWA|nr:hypothetical protein NDU88_004602 [Pleurodeles waltl]
MRGPGRGQSNISWYIRLRDLGTADPRTKETERACSKYRERESRRPGGTGVIGPCARNITSQTWLRTVPHSAHAIHTRQRWIHTHSA